MSSLEEDTPETPLIPYGPDQWRVGDVPPTLLVGSRLIPLVRKEGIVRLRHSKLEVIVSSNVRYSKDDIGRNQSVAASLRMCVNWLFTKSWKENPEFLDIFSVWKGKRGNTRLNPEKSKPLPADIDSINWIGPRIEYGQKKRGMRVHYQGVLEIYHWSNIRLNQKRCQEYLNFMLTYNRDKDVTPRPSISFVHRSIKGVYVHAKSLDNRTGEIYNMKSLILPYVKFLKDIKYGRISESEVSRRFPGDEETQSP